MENVLSVYQRPYDPKFPVVNLDESPKQLIGLYILIEKYIRLQLKSAAQALALFLIILFETT